MKRATKIDAHVGKRVRLRRLELDITQYRLGKLVNVTYQQVGKYENGVNRISAGRLYDLSKVLDVPVSYFFEGIDDTLLTKKENKDE